MAAGERLFTLPGAWDGGFYELEFECHDGGDARAAVVRALWSAPGVDGCFLDRAREPADQPLLPTIIATSQDEHALGCATLPNGARVACGSFCMSGELDRVFSFYVPLGSLGYVLPVGGFPFESHPATDRWRPLVDDWLCGLAAHVHARAPFAFARVDFEINDTLDAATIAAHGVPSDRDYELLLPDNGALRRFARTRG